MAAPERKVINEILTSIDPKTERLFRINAGMAWAGEIVKHTGGLLVLRNPRPFHGAPPGTPDVCGFKSIVITPEMIGKRIAVFVGVEVKANEKNPDAKLRRAQKMAAKLLTRLGAIYRVVSDASEADLKLEYSEFDL